MMQGMVLDLSGSIYQLGLSERVRSILDAALGTPSEGDSTVRICRISKLTKTRRSEITTLRGMDAKGVREIDEALSRIGLHLRRG